MAAQTRPILQTYAGVRYTKTPGEAGGVRVGIRPLSRRDRPTAATNLLRENIWQMYYVHVCSLVSVNGHTQDSRAMSVPFLTVRYAISGREVRVPIHSPTMTVKDVKLAVRALEGLALSDQTLSADGSDAVLGDDFKLASLGYAKSKLVLRQLPPPDWAAHCKKTATFWGNHGHYQWEAQWNAAAQSGVYPDCTHDLHLKNGKVHPVTNGPLHAALPHRRKDGLPTSRSNRAALGLPRNGSEAGTRLVRTGLSGIGQSGSQDTTRACLTGIVVTSYPDSIDQASRSTYVRNDDGSYICVGGARDAFSSAAPFPVALDD